MSDTSASRRPLQDVDTDAIASSGACEPSAKKSKISTADVMTFRSSHAPVSVELLSTNTIYDLVDILCRETTIGEEESVTDHMWKVQFEGNEYESGDIECVSPLRANKTQLGCLNMMPNESMVLEYDYGTTTTYNIKLVEQSVCSEEATFPRRKPVAKPMGYTDFVAEDANLNALFPCLNKWAFEDARPELNLFQAGRKQHFGYIHRDTEGVLHMIYLPTKPGKDLGNYLHCFNDATRIKYATTNGYPDNNWCSVVALPSDASTRKMDKYLRGTEPGFCECNIASTYTGAALNSTFPKVAALAGLKKDKKVPKGWICYQNKNLRICSGEAVVHKSNAPKGTAFDGRDQFEPAGPVLSEVDAEIQSLHQLFCVVEGLLRTL